MGILDFLKKKSSPEISKDELERQIWALDKLSQIFRIPPFMNARGAGRSEQVADMLCFYKFVFVYFYGTVYDYGDPLEFLGDEESIRFILTMQSLEQPATRRNILNTLPANWQETMKEMKEIDFLHIDFDTILNEIGIDGIGESISIFSRK